MSLANFFRTIAISALLTLSAQAPAAITSAFDGNWYDFEHSGQGFIFETFPVGNGETVLFVIFFTYDNEGKPLFFTAQDIVKPGVMRMVLKKPTIRGIVPGSATLPQPTFEDAGMLELDVSGCQEATAKVTINPIAQSAGPKIRVGTGSFRLQRIGGGATTQAKRCTGGISDNSFAANTPVFVDQSFSRPTLDARINFVRRPEASEFRLEFSKLPIGKYELVVDEVVRAEVDVVADATGRTSGTMLLRSPALEYTYDLDFVPVFEDMTLRGALPSNSSYRQIFTFSEPVRPITNGNEFGFSTAIPSSVRQANVLPAQVTGSLRGASDFRFNIERSNSGALNELRVKAEGVEAGTYEVFVNGDRYGRVQVSTRADGKTFGEIVFRSPVSPGSYPLEFQTLGSQIEFRRAGVTDYRFLLTP